MSNDDTITPMVVRHKKTGLLGVAFKIYREKFYRVRVHGRRSVASWIMTMCEVVPGMDPDSVYALQRKRRVDNDGAIYLRSKRSGMVGVSFGTRRKDGKDFYQVKVANYCSRAYNKWLMSGVDIISKEEYDKVSKAVGATSTHGGEKDRLCKICNKSTQGNHWYCPTCYRALLNSVEEHNLLECDGDYNPVQAL